MLNVGLGNGDSGCRAPKNPRPDDKWGEKVVAVLQLHAGRSADPHAIQAFVKQRIGSVKAPKLVEIWADLPRSKVGKVMKKDIRAEMLKRASEAAS